MSCSLVDKSELFLPMLSDPNSILQNINDLQFRFLDQLFLMIPLQFDRSGTLISACKCALLQQIVKFFFLRFFASCRFLLNWFILDGSRFICLISEWGLGNPASWATERRGYGFRWCFWRLDERSASRSCCIELRYCFQSRNRARPILLRQRFLPPRLFKRTTTCQALIFT